MRLCARWRATAILLAHAFCVLVAFAGTSIIDDADAFGASSTAEAPASAGTPPPSARVSEPRAARTLIIPRVLGAGDATDAGLDHAWILVNDLGAGVSALHHVPPPDAQRTPGGVRVPYGLEPLITRVAARGNEVLLIAEDPPQAAPNSAFAPPPGLPTRVLLLRAERAGSRWATLPPREPEALRSLPAERAVRGAAISSLGPVVVLDAGGRELDPQRSDEPEVLALRGPRWTRLTHPTETPFAPLALAAQGDDLALVTRSGLWLGTLTREDQPGPPAPARAGASRGIPERLSINWTLRGPMPDAWAQAEASSRERDLLWMSGTLIAWRVDGSGGLTLWTWSPAEGRPLAWEVLARLPEARSEVAVLPLVAAGRVLVTWSKPDAAAPLQTNSSAGESPDTLSDATGEPSGAALPEPSPRPDRAFAEISLGTGRVMESGVLQAISPVEREDYRFILILLTWLVGLVLVLVMQPQPGLPVLPLNASLAAPSLRVLATLADLIVWYLVAGVVLGMPWSELRSMPVTHMMTTADGQALLLTMLGLAIVGGSLLEATTGATLGKWMTGCRVVRDRSLPPGAWTKPSFPAAVVRNAVKWALPPVAFTAAWTPGSRHKGEVLSRTMVVVRHEPETPTSEE